MKEEATPNDRSATLAEASFQHFLFKPDNKFLTTKNLNEIDIGCLDNMLLDK